MDNIRMVLEEFDKDHLSGPFLIRVDLTTTKATVGTDGEVVFYNGEVAHKLSEVSEVKRIVLANPGGTT